MKEFVFKSNKTGIWSFVFSCFLSCFIIIASLAYKDILLIMFFVVFVGLRLGVYNSIDYLFTKTLYEKNGKLVLKISVINFQISKEDSFLAIGKDDITTRLSITSHGLYIVRNNKIWWRRIIKNRIKLLPKGGKYNLEDIMEEVANKFGLNSIDLREIDKLY
jgi:hypothetical protein